MPSQQHITLQEAFLEAQPDGALWLRLRFVAPAIAEGPGQLGFDVVEADMVHLCRTLGLALAAGQPVALVVVSVASSPVAFGATDPTVTQYFEAYRPAGDDCLWEAP